MIFLSDIQGTITAIVPDKIYQGSSNAKELILIAPFPSTSAVSAAIRLPNGQLLPPIIANSYMLSPLPAFSPAIFDRDGRNYHAWRMQLDAPLTAYSGDISVQFLLSTNGGDGVIEATSECIINIGRGTPYIIPRSPDGWQDVLNAIQALQQYVADNSEWDYVITPTEFSSAPGNSFQEKLNNLLSSLSAEVKRILMKGLYTFDTVSVAVPSTVTHLKMVNCSFGGQIEGHAGCYVEGARGAYSAETGYNTILLIYFGDVHNCAIASCLNCGRVTNSHLRLCHNDETYTLPYHIISDTFFEDFSDGDSPPAILNRSEVAKITNIGFINGNAGYREIRGAATVSGVWRVGDTPIRYSNCQFVDGLSCMDYYTAEDEGQAILASNGAERLLPVYSKSESDDRYVDKQSYTSDLRSTDADIQYIRDGLADAETDIDKNAQDISKNAADIAANTAAIEDVRNSVSRVYKYVGSVASFNLLPASANIGDVYNVESEYTDPVSGVVYPAGTNFAWDGSRWDPLGGDFGEYSERLATAESDISDLKDGVEALGTDLDTAKADITALEAKEEWDYVITKLEDFTTEKLATMSGRVLVKGVVYNRSGEEWGNTGDYIEALRVNIPSAIKVIKFINSTIYAFVTAISKDTQIEGFVGGGVSGYYYSELRGFGSVVKCGGYLDLYNCDNVISTTIQYAHSCQNLQNISVYGDYSDGKNYGFYNCTLISGVYFHSSLPWAEDDISYIIEFLNCKHISNVHNVNISNARFDYENCDWVDGDTCDGYYTEEDEGKVQTVNKDGSKSLISVYGKEEIDGMLGDIETSLDSIIAIQNALIGGTT